MAAQTPVRFAPPELLNDVLDRRVIDDFRLDARPCHHRLANSRILPRLIQQDAFEIDTAARIDVPEIDPDYVAFTDAILPRPIFKHSVHGKLPLLRSSSANR